jgi:urease accessory protein
MVRGRFVGLGAAALLLSATAQAHSSVQGVGDFYAGLLHPVTALEQAILLFALGLLVGQLGQRHQVILPVFWCSLAVGAVVAHLLPFVPGAVGWANLLSLLVVGGLIAAAKELPKYGYWAVALLFGFTHGYDNGVEIAAPTRALVFIPGVVLAAVLVSVYGAVIAGYVVRKKTDWMQIALRVAGSWTVAIGLLVLAARFKP